jgi:DnaK suppressor protein
MTPEERRELKEKILARIAELRDEMSAMEDSVRPVAPDSALGRLTRLEAMGAQGVSEAALSGKKAELSRLEHAMTKIDDPDFGECSICGETIPVKRLLVMPSAATCVKCAERGER